MPELGPYGFVRGARGNSRPYRDPRPEGDLARRGRPINTRHLKSGEIAETILILHGTWGNIMSFYFDFAQHARCAERARALYIRAKIIVVHKAGRKKWDASSSTAVNSRAK
jgi:hypothetical protein